MDDFFFVYNAKWYEVAYKSNGNCAICGESIDCMSGERGVDWNIDHVFPKALLKWPYPSSSFDSAIVSSLLSSLDNQIVTHVHCNVEKGCTLPTDEYINSLLIDDKSKKDLLTLKDKLKERIYTYREVLSKMLMKQHGCCYECKKALSDNCAPRRISYRSPVRNENTGVLLCRDCNSSWGV